MDDKFLKLNVLIFIHTVLIVNMIKLGNIC